MKGIDGILSKGGRSETTTGKEVELDFDSITSGVGVEMTMPNSTSGAKFLSLKSGTGDTEVAYIDKDGNSYVAGTFEAGGAATLAGGLNVSSGGFSVTGGATVSTGNLTVDSGYINGAITDDSTINSTNLSNGQYALNRVRHYCEYMEDFLDYKAYLGSGTTTPLIWTQTTGTTSPAAIVDGTQFGVMKLSGASCSAAGARCQAVLQHKNEFVKIVNGKNYYFETKIKGGANKFYRSELFIGLTNADTDLFAAPNGAPDCTDFIGFSKFQNSRKWHLLVGTQALADKTTASSARAVLTATTGTYYRLGFKVNTTGTGTTVVTPYVDGVALSNVTEKTSKAGTSVPSATALTWSSGISVGSTGGNTFFIDYVNIVQQR